MEKLAAKNENQVVIDKVNATLMQGSNKAQAQEAFNQIHKRYKSPIFYEVLKSVKMSKETADDLTQEIFIKVWEKIKKYDHSVAFSTWLYNIAKNHVIDHKRKTKIEILRVDNLGSEIGRDEEVNDIAFQLEDKSANIFKDVVRAERALSVMDALNNGVSSEDGKQIIALIFLDDMPYEKVAKLKKMPLGTVKAIMFRAKKEMRDYLSKESRDFSYAN
jgi:RNA polymerase sigma-70 factor (ECF subfamily)